MEKSTPHPPPSSPPNPPSDRPSRRDSSASSKAGAATQPSGIPQRRIQRGRPALPSFACAAGHGPIQRSSPAPHRARLPLSGRRAAPAPGPGCRCAGIMPLRRRRSDRCPSRTVHPSRDAQCSTEHRAIPDLKSSDSGPEIEQFRT